MSFFLVQTLIRVQVPFMTYFHCAGLSFLHKHHLFGVLAENLVSSVLLLGEI